MSRAVTIGNGNLLVGLDYDGQVRDLYYPYIGHPNHISGASGSYHHRVGVFVDGAVHWLSDDTWDVHVECGEATAASDIRAHNATIGVSLKIDDVVHNEHNVFLRRVRVTNERSVERTIKVFFAQQFRISESRRGDTGLFDPRTHAIIHYKGHQAFLINAELGGALFPEYTVGLFDSEGRAGSHLDAEDGELSCNAIEHGSADSVIGLTFTAGENEAAIIHYWIACAPDIKRARELNERVLKEAPDRMMRSAENYWHAWIDKESRDLSDLSENLQSLYKRSLSIIRVHVDDRGGIIASSDSDMLNQGRDTYAYVWPRDAAYVANALDRGGYHQASKQFFTFITSLVDDEGYLMHKYRSDGVLGSSWHPWVKDGKYELPIQEDETALVLFMLWQHYQLAHDIEFIEEVYNPFIEKAANFMCEYLDAETGLPRGSYDLWEEKYGTATYTAASVFGALTAASECATMLGKRLDAKRYRQHAERIREGILGYLFDADMGAFVKLVAHDGDTLRYDRTVDVSSLHGIVLFGVLPPFDNRVVSTKDVVLERLSVPSEHGGIMRYESDGYYRTSLAAPPNAWCITTLWLAQYYIQAAKSSADLTLACEILNWVYTYSNNGGVLPEQIDPYTGLHLSTAPLVWSHAEYVITVDAYLKKSAALKRA